MGWVDGSSIDALLVLGGLREGGCMMETLVLWDLFWDICVWRFATACALILPSSFLLFCWYYCTSRFNIFVWRNSFTLVPYQCLQIAILKLKLWGKVEMMYNEDWQMRVLGWPVTLKIKLSFNLWRMRWVAYSLGARIWFNSDYSCPKLTLCRLEVCFK